MGDTAGALLPLLLLALAFVVLIVLPMRTRSRQLQQTRALQAGLTVGTEVMTTSGLHARIVGLAEDTVELEVAPGVVVRWARAAIAEVRGPQPATDGQATPPAPGDGEAGAG
ncbi:MAG: preprotein translocase subunit YajC [Mycobacteriales bacterium]